MTTWANVHDSIPALLLVDRAAGVPATSKRRRCGLAVLMGDKAYGPPRNVSGCHARGMVPRLLRSRDGLTSGLGTTRYVVERTLACFGRLRRIKLCYERKGEHLQAFHDLVAEILCAKRPADST